MDIKDRFHVEKEMREIEDINYLEIDKKITEKIMKWDFSTEQAHICPSCGWETEDLETSSRCQACWANGDRVTMGDLEVVYDFHPSTNYEDSMQVLEKFYTYEVHKEAGSPLYEVTLYSYHEPLSSGYGETFMLAICDAARRTTD
jgi:predicted Zn-ribbon and HTH transcriptional regulator